MKYISYIAVAMMWLLTACSSEETGISTSEDVRVPLQLTADLGNASISVATRAANNAWAMGDAVGVYAVATGTTTAITDGTNVEYTASSAGTDNVPLAATEDPIYLPVDYSAVDVYAYYPRQNTVTMAGQFISVTDQTYQTAIDWMITGRTLHTTKGGSTAITRNHPTCELQFRHALCKLQFNLRHGVGMRAVDITGNPVSITIAQGLYTTATLNLYNGVLSGLGTNNIAITPIAMATAGEWLPNPTLTTDRSFEAIILPQTTGAAMTVTVTIGAATYTFDLPAPTTFEAGNRYVYNVSVNARTLTVTSTVTDWVTNQTINNNPIYM